MLRKKIVWGVMPIMLVGLMFLGGCRKPAPDKFAEHVVSEITAELQLNAAQQQELNGIKSELLGKLAEMKKSRESVHDQVLADLEKDALDPVQLKKLAAPHRAEMQAVVDLMIDRGAAFHATLTPDQKKKLVQFLKEKDQCRKNCFFGS